MNGKTVWLATFAVLASIGLAGGAAAQYRGYGYRYDEAPDYYYGTPYSPPGGYGGADPYGGPDGSPPRAGRRGDYGRDYGYGPDGDYGPAPRARGRDMDRDQMPYADPLYGRPRRGDPSYGYENPNNGGPDYGPDAGYAPGGGFGPGHKASDADLGEGSNKSTMTEVANTTNQPPGTIVINTAERRLYYTQPNGQALQYGIGVGREGFSWHGTARVERKSEWPDWIPPSDMLKRRPDLPTRMAGGLENPLGARAMYLFQGNKDTMFRIHGTNEPDSIGKAVSSGCIRMMNADVIDLYGRVKVGTKVVVL